MTDDCIWIRPDRVFDGARLHRAMALCLSGGRVVEGDAGTEPPTGTEVTRIAGLVTPGFVDLQVNGGGDILINRQPTPEAMVDVAAAHHRLGTVAILPTVITDTPDVLAAAAEAALSAVGRGGVAGLHIEGPHIAEARRGTHAARHIRPLDDRTVSLVERLRQADVPVMITLAPEAADPERIARLAASGAVVSLGHTDATAEDTRAALGAGAGCFTHLFNAMSPMLNRSPGVVGAAINSGAHAGIICDGIHVADEMVGLALRARPVPDRMFLVSDAMPTVGGSDSFRLYDMEIRLRDGRLVNSEGSLAGAHVTVAQSVARLVGVLGVAPETALRMAVTVPSRLMGLGLDRIKGRSLSDLLLLDAGLVRVGALTDHLPTACHAAQ